MYIAYHRRLIIIFLICAAAPVKAHPFIWQTIKNWWSDHTAFQKYTSKDYRRTQEILGHQQAAQEKFNDPALNYNLGVAAYRQADYAGAALHFDRAFAHAPATNPLKIRSGFNAGLSWYQQALATLGKDWESKKLDEKVLDDALKQAQESLKEYQKNLVLDGAHARTHEGKKQVEELIKKLLEKKQQQQKEKEQPQDKDKKDTKDQQDQQKQQPQDQQKNQEQKQNQSQNQDQQQKEQQPPQDQQKKQEETSQQEQEQQQKQKQQEEEKKEAGAQEEQQSPQKPPQEKTSASEENKQEAAAQKAVQTADAAEAANAMTGQEAKPESLEEKKMRALLEQLQSDEAQLQKNRMRLKAQQTPAATQGQKPW